MNVPTREATTLQRPVGNNTQLLDQNLLRRMCLGVTQWLEKADETEKRMALEALQVSVEATAATATLTGILKGPRVYQG